MVRHFFLEGGGLTSDFNWGGLKRLFSLFFSEKLGGGLKSLQPPSAIPVVGVL